MSDSVRPQRQQPTRLPHPWDSPGKNTGVGCHFLLHCMKVKSESEVAQSCSTLCNPVVCSPPGFSVHGILQARILEWVAVSSSRGSSRPKDQTIISGVYCFGRQILLPLSHLGSHFLSTDRLNRASQQGPKALRFTQKRAVQRKTTELKSNRCGHAMLSHF